MIAFLLQFFKSTIFAPVGFIVVTYLYFYTCRIFVIHAVERCTTPFERFWKRQSIVMKLLFKDILASFMGTLEHVYDSDQEDDLIPDVPLSPYQINPCNILAMSPKEFKSPQPVNTRRRLRLPQIQHSLAIGAVQRRQQLLID